MNKKTVAYLLKHAKPSIQAPHRAHTALTRRQLFGRGYLSMGGFVAMPSFLSLLNDQKALAQAIECGTTSVEESNSIPMICIDLGGGANIPGGNVIVGDRGGQLSFLPAGSYGSIGLAPEAEPGSVSLATDLGLAFHPESRIYQGIAAQTAETTRANVEGGIFCTSSDDDTGNNPLNPTYWLAKAGAQGKVVALAGNNDSVSGGRSIAPEESIDLSLRPALVQRPEDCPDLIVPGLLANMIGSEGVAKVMNWTKSLSQSQLQNFQKLSVSNQAQQMLQCAYPQAIDQVTRFQPDIIDPAQDPVISSVFDLNNGDDRRAGSIAKLLLDGFAGAGTVTLGGFDYHGNPRTVTDQRDQRAGDVIGKCLEAAAQKQKPLVVYVFTDGGVGCRQATPDAATPGRFNASSDSGQRSSAFMLVYNPTGKPQLRLPGGRQIGAFKASGSVDNDVLLTSNSVTNLTKAIVANYMSLTGQEGRIEDIVGSVAFRQELEQYLLFQPLT